MKAVVKLPSPPPVETGIHVVATTGRPVVNLPVGSGCWRARGHSIGDILRRWRNLGRSPVVLGWDVVPRIFQAAGRCTCRAAREAGVTRGIAAAPQNGYGMGNVTKGSGLIPKP